MGTRLRWMVVMAGCIKISALLLLLFVCTSYERPQFNFGSILTNGLGAAFNTALGRDCKGRPQGDYFYGCQCVGPFNIGKRKRSAPLRSAAVAVNRRQTLTDSDRRGSEYCKQAVYQQQSRCWRRLHQMLCCHFPQPKPGIEVVK